MRIKNATKQNHKSGGEVLDGREYERIVKENIDTIYRIALSYTKSTQDADDVVQQTFMKLLTKQVSFKDEEHIKKWLIRVCVNECNSLFSTFWRRNVGSTDEMSEEASYEVEFADGTHEELFEAIKELPAKSRIVIYLFYYEDYSSKEIAEILHIKEPTVRTRLVAARKMLRAKLKEAWEDE